MPSHRVPYQNFLQLSKSEEHPRRVHDSWLLVRPSRVGAMRSIKGRKLSSEGLIINIHKEVHSLLWPDARQARDHVVTHLLHSHRLETVSPVPTISGQPCCTSPCLCEYTTNVTSFSIYSRPYITQMMQVCQENERLKVTNIGTWLETLSSFRVHSI